MATFNLTVTYPDADVARVIAALKTYYTIDGVVPTNAQVAEKLRLVVAANVRDIVARVEREAAVAAAAAGVVPVSVT